MADQTHSTGSGQEFTLPPLPKILPGKEVYDSIMKQIEPELLSSVLPTLKEKYANESLEEKEERRKRYNSAFAKYDEMYQAYMADLDARIHRYYKTAMGSIEERSRIEEEKKLEHLEASMFKLA